MDCIAQEMEREEGEGVQGRVRPEGEEEGGQGHQEQDDGQGVEVPELQVGIVQHNNQIITKICSVLRSNISGTTWTRRSGNAATGMDSVGIALTRRTREEERTSWRLGRTAFSGDGEKMKHNTLTC